MSDTCLLTFLDKNIIQKFSKFDLLKIDTADLLIDRVQCFRIGTGGAQKSGCTRSRAAHPLFLLSFRKLFHENKNILLLSYIALKHHLIHISIFRHHSPAF